MLDKFRTFSNVLSTSELVFHVCQSFSSLPFRLRLDTERTMGGTKYKSLSCRHQQKGQGFWLVRGEQFKRIRRLSNQGAFFKFGTVKDVGEEKASQLKPCSVHGWCEYGLEHNCLFGLRWSQSGMQVGYILVCVKDENWRYTAFIGLLSLLGSMYRAHGDFLRSEWTDVRWKNHPARTNCPIRRFYGPPPNIFLHKKNSKKK